MKICFNRINPFYKYKKLYDLISSLRAAMIRF